MLGMDEPAMTSKAQASMVKKYPIIQPMVLFLKPNKVSTDLIMVCTIPAG